MSTCLVTGAAGFIGSAIAAALVAEGKTVRALDNLSTGLVSNLSAIRSSIELTIGDLCDEELLDILCEGVDVIFHQAAIASVAKSFDDPIGTWAVNVEGTRRLIHAARKAGVRRLVFASSSAIYGDAAHQPVDESNALAPLSPYATQKLACELMLQEVEAEDGLETVSLRYFNVFGPHQSADSPYSGAIARFFQGMTAHEPETQIDIFGDGSHTRDFVYISDVVAANLAAAYAEASSVSGKSFNIGSGCAHSVLQVAQHIAAITGFSRSLEHREARLGEVRRSVADIRQATAALSFKPAISLNEGLLHTFRWFLENRAPAVEAASAQTRSMHILPARRRVSHTVSHSIEHDEFSLAYQPIVRLPSGKTIGVEALLRHKYEDQGRAPLRIIRMAEATGSIVDLGAWCLQAACKDLPLLRQAFGPALRISVNISVRQLEHPDFVNSVERMLVSGGIDPSSFELEITERVMISQGRMARHALRNLQEMGLSTALDDFGCGHANLQHLCQMHVDRLKTDRSILRQSSKRWPIFEGLVAFARQLNIPLVAEGIETKTQLQKVLKTRCQEAQGYLFSKPVPLGQLVEQATLRHAVA